MKRCTRCKIERDESEFYKNAQSKSGLNTVCKHCFKEYYKRIVKSRFSTICGETKRCNMCGEFLSFENFYVNIRTGYIESTCKKCRSLIRAGKYTRKIPAINGDGTKVCRNCNESKNIEEFYRNRCICNDCSRVLRRKKMYGLADDDFNIMLQNQNGECAICGGIRVTTQDLLCVDHCHKTNNVRGLLCNHCNTALGKFEDNIELLQNAIKYLKNSEI